MNRLRLGITVFLLMLVGGVLVPGVAAEKNPEADRKSGRQFLEAVQLYENGLYAAAADKFQAVAEGGIENGKLYYNLGNARFKAGQLGRAVYWYEKARRLIPGDPELAFNLEYARSQVKDRGPAENRVVRAVFFWRYWLGQSSLIVLSVACSVLFFSGLLLKRHFRVPMPAAVLAVVLALGILFTATAGFNYYRDLAVTRGIVLPDKISVRAGFSEFSTELFVLHGGSRVTIEKQRNDFFRIRFGDDKIGWVDKGVIGVI